MRRSGLEQFYTKDHIASLCWKSLLPVLRRLTGKSRQDLFFIEPSAGDGAFFNLLPKGDQHRIGVDIDPKSAGLIKADFLSWNYKSPFHRRQDIVVVGNPPFGTRGDLAIEFFNKASQIADTIAFIVPVIFRKFAVHKELAGDFRWIYTTDLQRDAFRTHSHKDYKVNTEFQIWTRLDSASYKNGRLFVPPPTSHPDFSMWQYNNTVDALKVFDNPFDFAVPCQGWQNYDRRESSAEECEKHKQWILLKPKDKNIYEKLFEGINYRSLAEKSATTTPGFRKNDLVLEYNTLYG